MTTEGRSTLPWELPVARRCECSRGRLSRLQVRESRDHRHQKEASADNTDVRDRGSRTAERGSLIGLVVEPQRTVHPLRGEHEGEPNGEFEDGRDPEQGYQPRPSFPARKLAPPEIPARLQLSPSSAWPGADRRARTFQRTAAPRSRKRLRPPVGRTIRMLWTREALRAVMLQRRGRSALYQDATPQEHARPRRTRSTPPRTWRSALAHWQGRVR
jgi:hypothetical protein